MLERGSLWEHLLPVKVRGELCPRSRSPRAQCRACIETCPSGAIAFAEQGPLLSGDCEECGLCVGACPNGVFEIQVASDGYLRAAAVEMWQQGGTAVFTCQQGAKTVPGAIPVRCLGRWPWELITELALQGPVAFYRPAIKCSSCPLKAGADLFAAACSRAAAFLAGYGMRGNLQVWERPTEIAAAPRRPRVRGGRGRREVIVKALGLLAQASGVKPADRGKTPGRAAGSLRRAALLEILADMAPSAVSGGALPLPSVILEGTCFFCGACSRLCPQKALRQEELNLLFYPGLCTGCGLCAATCLYGSLVLEAQVSSLAFAFNQPEELATGKLQRCACCGASFVASALVTECPSCSAKRHRLKGGLDRSAAFLP